MRDIALTINEKQYVLVRKETVAYCDECALCDECYTGDKSLCDLGVDDSCNNLNLLFVEKQ